MVGGLRFATGHPIVAPAGVSDPINPPDVFEMLMNARNGFAAAVTGGDAGAEYVVDNLNTSGSGSLRDALVDPAPLKIRFGVDGQIDYDTVPPELQPNKTITGFGRNITIQGRGWRILGDKMGTPTANIIIAYLSFVGRSGSGTDPNDDLIRVAKGGDLTWVHHCDFTDWFDGAIDVTNSLGNEVNCTIDWCKFGPGPGLIRWTAAGPGAEGKQTIIGQQDFDILHPHKIRCSYHHNFGEHVIRRQPKGNRSWLHVYNCYVKKWGRPSGSASHAMRCTDETHMLMENNSYESYSTGEDHWFTAYAGSSVPVTSADKDAFESAGGSLQKVKATGNRLKNGEDFEPDQDPGNIFVPPYSYTLETADDTMEAAIVAGAGNIQS